MTTSILRSTVLVKQWTQTPAKSSEVRTLSLSKIIANLLVTYSSAQCSLVPSCQETVLAQWSSKRAKLQLTIFQRKGQAARLLIGAKADISLKHEFCWAHYFVHD